MARISHANSIDKSIQELSLEQGSPKQQSGLHFRRPSNLRVNTTRPTSRGHTPPGKNVQKAASQEDDEGSKPFSVTNLDTGETISIEEIDRLISRDSLTTFSSPYAKGGTSSPFKAIYDQGDTALIKQIEGRGTPEKFLKELRLCDSPKKVQPNDYFAKISGNFGVKVVGNILVRGAKEAIYTVYIMEVRHDQYDLASKTWRIFRRYRQFYALNECLRVKGYKLPPFPPKKMIGTFEPGFVAKRQKLLASYLEKLLTLPPLNTAAGPLNPRHSQTVRFFFTDGADELPKGVSAEDVRKVMSISSGGVQTGAVGNGKKSARRGKQASLSGSVTLDDFQLIKVIGKGSFAKVVLVRKKDNEKLYAMKILKKDHIIKRKQVEHTKTERAVLRFTRHPFIVQLHYAFQTADRLFFVLDYCSGGELFFHLGKAGEFRESVAMYYTAELVLALSHLHSKGVIYRDLKPENVLLDAEGHVLIADFGLSKVVDKSALKKDSPNRSNVITRLKDMDSQQTFSFCGTPEYLAPEILTRSGHGKGVDWWSLGMLLYEMLTGLPPWYTKDRRELFRRIQTAPLTFPRTISPQAQAIIRGLLQRNVHTRLGHQRTNGIEGIKSHEFFNGIDWVKLFNRELPTPFNPSKLNHGETDVSNFDKSFTRIPVGSVAQGDYGTMQKEKFKSMFKNFSYEGSPSMLTE
jgi:serine/threonine protein kinase